MVESGRGTIVERLHTAIMFIAIAPLTPALVLLAAGVTFRWSKGYWPRPWVDDPHHDGGVVALLTDFGLYLQLNLVCLALGAAIVVFDFMARHAGVRRWWLPTAVCLSAFTLQLAMLFFEPIGLLAWAID